MITFEEWTECDEITKEFAPAQYERVLRKSISEMNRDAAAELTIMGIRADAHRGRLPELPIKPAGFSASRW
ncbi:MAG: hypothetical protein JXX14_15960 [Deltaproteobacteria bacterium]|nr:hypothetical protein [Deltaproteobacteria bacterium]